MGNLIIAGPTGTNVNDLSLVLIDGDSGTRPTPGTPWNAHMGNLFAFAADGSL